MQVNICWQHLLANHVSLGCSFPAFPIMNILIWYIYTNMPLKKNCSLLEAEYVMHNCYMNMRSSGIY